MSKLMDITKLANGKGLAERLGVSRPALANWQVRYADFPKAIDLPLVDGIPLWDVREVDKWYNARIKKTAAPDFGGRHEMTPSKQKARKA